MIDGGSNLCVKSTVKAKNCCIGDCPVSVLLHHVMLALRGLDTVRSLLKPTRGNVKLMHGDGSDTTHV